MTTLRGLEGDMTRRLLVEGWRGVPHSYALLAQHQMLAMRTIPGLRLTFQDAPFYSAAWTAGSTGTHFEADETAFLATLPPPSDDEKPDVLYRVCSPYRIEAGPRRPSCPVLHFMATETGLSRDHFVDGVGSPTPFEAGDQRIVTPSIWSRDRLIDWGLPAQAIHVAPLGVDTRLFRPSTARERAQARARLRIADDETLFLNIGSPLLTKGTDLLLRAFAVLRLRGLPVRLVMKDQSHVYGTTLRSVMRTLGDQDPNLRRQEVLSGITVIQRALEPDRLSALIGGADCYVSPYRAEGFNLPVLEAIACGVPVVVTRGGATDAFCNDDLALRIPGRFQRSDGKDGIVGAYIAPDMEALIAAMTRFALGARPHADRFEAARQDVLSRFTWTHSAAETLRIALA